MIKINEFFAILLMILPGVLTEKIVRFCGSVNKEKKHSDFMTTINGILYSLPIVIFVGFVADWLWGFDNITEIFDSLSSIRFLAVFMAMSVATSIIFGIVVAWFIRKYQNPIRHLYRKKYSEKIF